MRLHSIAGVVFAVIAFGGQSLHGPAAPDGGQPDRIADLAAIEKVRRQDISATIARDSVALTDLWTDDAIRLGTNGVAEIGKEAIRASNERQTANKDFKVLTYVPEIKDFKFLDGGFAVEWRTYTASFVPSPGAEPAHVRGTLLGVWKKLPDGSWKIFRALGSVEPAKAGGL